ncbi:MAG: aminopeptidase N C-terminal domain-containing protein, partial [Alphaproteobacteria bacterium]|nr:aminopeptidase N C-terminal domain-containing protein [Alphaproteobacteria bacterium]
ALRDKRLDPDFKAMVLSLPGENELGLAKQARGELIDIEALYAARKELVKHIAFRLRDSFASECDRLSKTVKDTKADGETMGRRALRNLCLSYLAQTGDPKTVKLLYKQATTSKNMTDRIAALAVLADLDTPLRDKAFAAFDKKWRKIPTVMDKWLMVQAASKRADVLKTVRKLLSHPAFTFKNPNRISALIGVFGANGLGFHAKDGSGYKFIADMILKIDPMNPHSAASLAKNFSRWRDYTHGRQKLMQAQLVRLSKAKLSANASEVVQKSLKG